MKMKMEMKTKLLTVNWNWESSWKWKWSCNVNALLAWASKKPDWTSLTVREDLAQWNYLACDSVYLNANNKFLNDMGSKWYYFISI